jgi:hypothetical protein
MSAYLDAPQAAAHYGKSVNAFYAFLCRRRKAGFPVKTYRLGRLLKFRVADLDDAMTVEQSRHFGKKAS